LSSRLINSVPSLKLGRKMPTKNGRVEFKPLESDYT
jgi:hypothetical protein